MKTSYTVLLIEYIKVCPLGIIKNPRCMELKGVGFNLYSCVLEWATILDP